MIKSINNHIIGIICGIKEYYLIYDKIIMLKWHFKVLIN